MIGIRIVIFISSLFLPAQVYAQLHDSLSIEPKEEIELNENSKSYTRTDTEFFIAIEASLSGRHIDSLPIVLRSVNADSLRTDLRGITDSSGIVIFKPEPIKSSGNYIYEAKSKHPSKKNSSIRIEIQVRENDWIINLIIGLLGGLSLFLYGMHLLSNGLQNAAGTKMRQFLEKLTYNRFIAAGAGALITTVIQSSSATNVMLVSFVDARLMRFRQSIGIILGAAIGTTITAQIIAFKLTDYALIFVTTGLILFLLTKKPKLSEIAKSILGFGILFFGMRIMSESMHPLRSFHPFLNLILSLENPLYGILVGTIFTALIQSSSAFIGILIVLAMQGLLSFHASVSLIIGANIGTSITAILASINTSREARQVAFAHTFIKLLGAGLILLCYSLFIDLVDLLVHENITQTSVSTPRLIAHVHTIYNIVIFILFIPITKPIANLVEMVYPAKADEENRFSPIYINNSLLSTPEAALISARKEVLLMMQEVKMMFESILIPFEDRNVDEINNILLSEKKVNLWRDSLTDFLVLLSQGERSKEQIKEIFILLNANKEFEQIADTISGPLAQKACSWCSANYEFSPEGWKEIQTYHQDTLKIIRKAIKAYADFDLKKARKLKIKYDAYREEYFELERKHYKRLGQNLETTISSSKTHLELITLFRVISSHATNTARTIIDRKGK